MLADAQALGLSCRENEGEVENDSRESVAEGETLGTAEEVAKLLDAVNEAWEEGVQEVERQDEALKDTVREGCVEEGVRLRMGEPDAALYDAVAVAPPEALGVPEKVEEGQCAGVTVDAAERSAEAESEGEGVKVGRGQSAKTEPGLPEDVAQEMPAAPPSEKRRGVAFLPSVTLRQLSATRPPPPAPPLYTPPKQREQGVSEPPPLAVTTPVSVASAVVLMDTEPPAPLPGLVSVS